MISLIRDLQDVSMAERSLAGGKAASLGELIKEGVNIPAGFLITTEAYGNMNDELAAEILAHFDELGSERVAVRLSAIAEDALTASWAGQLETSLNVNRDGVLKAVTNCWRSVNSEHARSYADQNNVPTSERRVAAIIQEMVEAEIAGVVFTANPVTNNISQCIIEAIYGLGELLVQGAVTPETFIIDKESGKVVDHTPHRQRIMLVFRDGGNIEEPVATAQDTRILNNSQLKKLLKQARLIEKLFGQPQDIEWAFLEEELFVLQSRPITTLLT